jgi:hopanoid biosynthesis associated RND transporter like protein HpnN
MKPEPSAAEAPFVHRCLTGLVEQVCRYPRSVLVAALVLATAAVGAACARLEYRTQRTDLMSPDKESQKRWRQYVEEFGDDDDIVVVVKGQDPAQMKRALDALAEQVAARPGQFDRLFYKVDLRALCDRALLFLPSEQIAQVQENLQSMSMLLDPPVVGTFDPLIGWKSITLQRLLHEARDRAVKILPDRPPSAADEQFLTQLHAISRSATAYLDNPANYRTPWHSLLAHPPEQQQLLSEPQYFFSGDRSLAFLLTRPVKQPGSFTAAQASVETMRDIVANVRGQFPDLEVGLTGLPVLETDEMVASQQDTNLASWAALAGVALLYLVVFRSVRNPAFTVATLLIGTAWAVGWLTLTVGHLNILSATFAVMLIGMGDYGVLWVTRYEEERAAGADVVGAMRNTAASVGTGILTAATTTSLAFFAAMLADFQAVAELGWIAGCGVLLCAFSCFTVMPALLCLFGRERCQDRFGADEPILLKLSPPAYRPAALAFSRRLAARSRLARAGAWLPPLAQRPRWVIGASAVACSVLAVFACRVYYDHNLLHLQARDLDSVQWEQTLIKHTAGASWHALSYTASQQEALALKARYEKLPEVNRVVEVAALVPLDQERKLEQLRDVQQRLRRLPERGAEIPHSLPSTRHVKFELDCLVGSLQPLADVTPQPLLGELRRSLMALRERLAEVPASLTAERLRLFEQRLAGDLAEDLHRLRAASTPRAITVPHQPADQRTRYVGQSGKWLLRVFAKDSLWDYAPLTRFVSQTRTVDPEATGKPFSTLEGLRGMKHGFEWAGVYALAAIVLVFLTDFRKPLYVLAALAPLAMGVVMSLGILGLCGLPLNPANMIAFPLILGVGADNGVHVLHDYLSQRRKGAYTLNHTTGRGITVAALTTVLGFGTLMISHHRGLFGLGFILTLGVTCCMLTALIFLPAVLRGMSMPEEPAAAFEEQPCPERMGA